MCNAYEKFPYMSKGAYFFKKAYRFRTSKNLRSIKRCMRFGWHIFYHIYEHHFLMYMKKITAVLKIILISSIQPIGLLIYNQLNFKSFLNSNIFEKGIQNLYRLGIRNPLRGIRNPQWGIRNPKSSRITLRGLKKQNSSLANDLVSIAGFSNILKIQNLVVCLNFLLSNKAAKSVEMIQY